MKAGPILSMLVAMAAVPVAAQVPPTQLPKGAPAGAVGTAPKIPGVSDAGNAVFAKSRPALAQALTPLVQQQNALGPQLNAVVNAPTLDVAKFGALLQQRRQLLGQITAKQDEWLVSVLNQMPAADRSPFLKAVAARQQQASAPAR